MFDGKMQALSCDEAFLDVTGCDDDPEEIASMIRKEIEDTTRCTASAGIAGNLLLAYLATRSAKPNGQRFIPSEKVRCDSDTIVHAKWFLFNLKFHAEVCINE